MNIKQKVKQMKQLTGILLMLLVVLSACSEDDSSNSTRFVVRLTDSPGDYEKVNIDIVGIEVNAEENDESGWTTLDNVNVGVYDLLELTDGVETVLADTEFPSGHISQLRLLLGDNNSVVVDGETINLTTPSSQESGLKLSINADLVEGITYSLLLDFDAARSVVQAGNSGAYNLKPVIKVVAEAVDGAISGIITPDSVSVAVFAIIGEDTLGTSYAVEDSEDFFIGGLSAGTYSVVFEPGELSGLDTLTIEGVNVVVEAVTDLGTNALIE